MPDPTTSSLLGIPGYVFLWVLTLAALTLFGLRAYRLVAALARGRAEARWDRLPRRLWNTVVNVAGQRRMFANPGIGLAHLVIFWAFLFYAVSFAWNLLRGLLPFLPIPYADEVAWMAFPMEWLTLAAMVALAGAAIRRYVFTPARLSRSRDATIILLLISLLLVTFLMGQGAKAAAEEGPASWSPVGEVIGGWLGGMSTERGRGPLPRHVVAPHDCGPRLPGLPAVLQAPPPAGFPVQRVRRLAGVGGHAACFRRSGPTRGVHLAGAVQRPGLRRVRALRPGVPGFRLRRGAVAQGSRP